MSNSVDLDETAHLDLCCLQKPITIIIACGSERVVCPRKHLESPWKRVESTKIRVLPPLIFFCCFPRIWDRVKKKRSILRDERI